MKLEAAVSSEMSGAKLIVDWSRNTLPHMADINNVAPRKLKISHGIERH
jgi:hypothetical protein